MTDDDLRWSWCNNNRNKVHNKCKALGSSWNHSPIPTLVHGKIVFCEAGPWYQKGQGSLQRTMMRLILQCRLRAIPINGTQCSEDSVCLGLLPSPCVQFVRKEPFKMTVKNHTATLLPSTPKTLHVTFPSTAKEIICSVVSFSSKRLQSPCAPQPAQPGAWGSASGVHGSFLGVCWLLSLSIYWGNYLLPWHSSGRLRICPSWPRTVLVSASYPRVIINSIPFPS